MSYHITRREGGGECEGRGVHSSVPDDDVNTVFGYYCFKCDGKGYIEAQVDAGEWFCEMLEAYNVRIEE